MKYLSAFTMIYKMNTTKTKKEATGAAKDKIKKKPAASTALAKVTFHIHYSTVYGEEIEFVLQKKAGNKWSEEIFSMQYMDNGYWQLELAKTIFEQANESCSYCYRYKGPDQSLLYEAGPWRIVRAELLSSGNLQVYDYWNPVGDVLEIFNSAAFEFGDHSKKKQPTSRLVPQKDNCVFEVNVPLVQTHQELYLLGNAAVTGNWKISKKCKLQKNPGPAYSLALPLTATDFPFEYKYALYDTKEKTWQFEDGANRIIHTPEEGAIAWHRDGFGRFQYYGKKAFGVSIPVFSLRSKTSGGVGEFNDLKLLGNWAAKFGCSLVQILPVNDTTTTGGWTDSYPYSAISAFALHPMYLHLPAVAGKKYQAVYEKYETAIQELNALPRIDYEAVNKLKWAFIREIFPKQKKQVLASKSFQDFFQQNRYWLESYAAFCFLRDKYQTADFTQWPAYKKFSEAAIKKLSREGTASAEVMQLHFYVQYLLHNQLADAAHYLQTKGICLKGDIAIGMKQESADHWQYPEYFHTLMQTGAPPDEFSVKGQNWGFPTYNWAEIKATYFQWWQQKLQHYSLYHGAVRLDHVLGFFRIWSIPKENLFGTLGYFQPAMALQEKDFWESHLYFDEERFCKPYISTGILWKLFGEQMELVIQQFFMETHPHRYQFKEAFATQKKLQEHFDPAAYSIQDEELFAKLMQLHTEVILIKEEGKGFHFRVNMAKTNSFQTLDGNTKAKLLHLYHSYFYERQEALWKAQGSSILPFLHKATNMLLCAEDLGWSPGFVEPVLYQNCMLSLEVQRMPKRGNGYFTNMLSVPYRSVVTPGTHDMPVIRDWWKKDNGLVQYFYNQYLKLPGEKPEEPTSEILYKIFKQFLFSPAMWCILPWQDMVGCDPALAYPEPEQEWINNPDDAHNKWDYRMHLNLEELDSHENFTETWKQLLQESGRS